MSQLDSTGLKRLHRSWRQRGHERLALVLDRVQNPFNLGAIVRTAAAERVDHIYLGAAAAPEGPKVAKTSLGTERYLTWSSFDDPAGAVAAARTDGYRIVGVELAAGARPLHELALNGPVALVLGHEEHGLSKDTINGCDEVGFIPQLGRVGSLNLAAAAAIAIYEVRRQQWTAPAGSSGPERVDLDS